VTTRSHLLIVSILASIFRSQSSQAVPYDFVVVATTNPGPFIGFPGQGLVPTLAPSLDADGSVAFVGRTASGTAVFLASHPSTVLSDFTQITDPTSISIGGTNELGRFTGGALAFSATTIPDAEDVIDRWTGTQLVPLLVGPAALSRDGPAVNALGTLVYSDADELLLADVQGSSVLFQLGDEAAGGAINSVFDSPAPDINDLGQVAFFATGSFNAGICNEAILLDDASVALGSDENDGEGCGFDPGTPGFDLVTSAPLAINKSGSVAYAVQFDLGAGDVPSRIFVDQTQIWDADTAGFESFFSVTEVALSDSGTVAFLLTGDNTAGVFTGPDPVADKVLAIGDPLCGSTVTAVNFQRYGINASDQLALAVELADSRALIVRAEPSTGPGDSCTPISTPEPDAQMLAAAAIVALRGKRQLRGSRRTISRFGKPVTTRKANGRWCSASMRSRSAPISGTAR
jgi:hypothetical protein